VAPQNFLIFLTLQKYEIVKSGLSGMQVHLQLHDVVIFSANAVYLVGGFLRDTDVQKSSA
jgi:hypothetical protein